jgi:transcriptional regulator with XRE-family HTH domain
MPKRTREKDPIPGSLGAVVREERKRRGWSQEGLAERAGIGQNDVSRVETGKSKNPQEPTLLAIAQALETPLGVLYERTYYPEVSYQILPLRTQLKTMDADEQTLVMHLARFIHEHPELTRTHTPEGVVALFAQAVRPPRLATSGRSGATL